MDLLSGNDLKELGIYRAVKHADDVQKDWQIMAYEMLLEFIEFSDGKPFMCEEVRAFASKNSSLQEPPTNRAWGAVIHRAKGNGIIKHCGFGQVENPKAHQANASIWKGVTNE